jgi:hypothetical protein
LNFKQSGQSLSEGIELEAKGSNLKQTNFKQTNFLKQMKQTNFKQMNFQQSRAGVKYNCWQVGQPKLLINGSAGA